MSVAPPYACSPSGKPGPSGRDLLDPKKEKDLKKERKAQEKKEKKDRKEIEKSAKQERKKQQKFDSQKIEEHSKRAYESSIKAAPRNPSSDVWTPDLTPSSAFRQKTKHVE